MFEQNEYILCKIYLNYFYIINLLYYLLKVA